jgi:hypothetical protein
MEKYSKQNQKNLNNINNLFNQNAQDKILRSKSKNIYLQQKQHHSNKQKNNSNAYTKPKITQNIKNNNNNNINEINSINYNYNYNNNNNDKLLNKINSINYENEFKMKKLELIELKLLREENETLKKKLSEQNEKLNSLKGVLFHNYTKIKSLRKQYEHYKRALHRSFLDESNENNLLKEKMEEEFALRMVEQQIMDEICPNPDKMSYEQLLQLEEEVGNVNKGMSKDKIKEIPLKPYHKALFEDNCQCIICMENFSENELVKQLPCGHIFHGDCIDHWLSQQKNCRFCKAECSNFH